MLEGQPSPLGATPLDHGVNFAIFSGTASAVELCLFSEDGAEVSRHLLPGNENGVWHGFMPDMVPGQRYGYRIHGPYAPERGLCHNPSKLLIDPYARILDGQFVWSPAVFGFESSEQPNRPSSLDSAPFVPKCRVPGPGTQCLKPAPKIPWSETVIYETNLRGFTMGHPQLTESDRGTFAGIRNAMVLEYLKSLGITSVELMPVQAFIDEKFLNLRGLRNFWGYNTISFFAPAGRLMGEEGISGFQEMTNAIHDAGMEVILDVAYNHTGESDSLGPTLCFRGIDNLAYYRTQLDDPGIYINDTGCGNTFNTDHPRARQLIIDSLRYWATEMGVDGFRFDLASALGRTPRGFAADHPLLKAIDADPVLSRTKRIAEPWDIGPGGYQLGGFPSAWAEWNDQYRDGVRRFWRGDAGSAGEFARRIHGSSDLFEHSARRPQASVNLVTAHDGFCLADLVSYESRQNLANGEENRDGHAHNFSRNFGVEGPTDDPEIKTLRRRQRLNFLATLLISQGVPMLLAGDEWGNSQLGNNNAYAQDNSIGWLDWSGQAEDPEFTSHVRQLIALRRNEPLLRQEVYLHEADQIGWWHPDGRPMLDSDWSGRKALALLLFESVESTESGRSLVVAFNPCDDSTLFRLPEQDWICVFYSAQEVNFLAQGAAWVLAPWSMAIGLEGESGS